MSYIIGQKSTSATSPENTGVIIMAGGEGMGRKLSLKFASAGYTVFACLPHDVHTPRGTSSSSSVSPLLYIWQSRRARSQQSNPQWLGSIVPLVFDAAVPDECERAVDTIRAYCERHTLRLGAVIVPPISPMPGSDSGSLSPSDPQGLRWRGKRSLTPPSRLVQTSQVVFHDAMARCIFQPLGVIQALTRILHEAHSHVIFMSGCDETSFQPIHALSSVIDSARQSSARTLAGEIQHLGIQVSLVIFGPWRKRATSVVKLESDEGSLRRRLALLSLLWAVDDQTCFNLIQRIVHSSHVRPLYLFGLDVHIQCLFATFIPDDIQALIRRKTSELVGSLA